MHREEYRDGRICGTCQRRLNWFIARSGNHKGVVMARVRLQHSRPWGHLIFCSVICVHGPDSQSLTSATRFVHAYSPSKPFVQLQHFPQHVPPPPPAVLPLLPRRPQHAKSMAEDVRCPSHASRATEAPRRVLPVHDRPVFFAARSKVVAISHPTKLSLPMTPRAFPTTNVTRTSSTFSTKMKTSQSLHSPSVTPRQRARLCRSHRPPVALKADPHHPSPMDSMTSTLR